MILTQSKHNRMKDSWNPTRKVGREKSWQKLPWFLFGELLSIGLQLHQVTCHDNKSREGRGRWRRAKNFEYVLRWRICSFHLFAILVCKFAVFAFFWFANLQFWSFLVCKFAVFTFFWFANLQFSAFLICKFAVEFSHFSVFANLHFREVITSAYDVSFLITWLA